MVGNTGRKCSSQGINVIGGGAHRMGNLYKALLSPKSTCKYNLLCPNYPGTRYVDWLYSKTNKSSTSAVNRYTRSPRLVRTLATRQATPMIANPHGPKQTCNNLPLFPASDSPQADKTKSLSPRGKIAIARPFVRIGTIGSRQIRSRPERLGG
jgi:hypothetical protein